MVRLLLALLFILIGCNSEVEITTYEFDGKNESSVGDNSPNLVINNNQPLNATEFTTFTLNSSLFNIDNGGSLDQLSYKILSLPSFGNLTKNDVKLAINDTFTQSELENNLIKFENLEILDAEQFEATKNFELALIINGSESAETFDLEIEVAPFCEDKTIATTYNQFGNGTKEDPFIICTAIQFNDIGANNLGWDKHYILKADIDLGAFTGIDYNIIGNSTTPFSGSFDGLNYTISNFTYDDLVRDQVGIFGVIKGPYQSIKNFNITSANVRGRNEVGILAGRVQYVDLNHIKVSGSVQGVDDVGGMIGYSTSSTGAYLGSTANVSSTGQSTGGIGGNADAFYLENIFWRGNLTASDGRSGGLFGEFNVGKIKNCYAEGTVTSTSYRVGGLVGRFWSAPRMFNCFVDVEVTGNSTGTTVGLLIGEDNGYLVNTFYESNKNCTNNGTGTCNTLYQTNPIDTLAQTDYFQLNSNEPLASWDFTDGWQEVGLDLPNFNFIKPDPTWGDCSEHSSDSPFAGGTGTHINPYLICTPEQFNQIGTDPLYYTKSFKVMQDIDLGSLGSSYNIIGNSTDPFEGKISAVGYEIQNLTINLPTTDEIGLIGAMEIAFLAGIRMTNVNITGQDAVGAIVGIINANVPNATILSSVSGAVNGRHHVGGFVGFGFRSAIIESYNEATVTGTTEVGGIFGGINANVYIGQSFNSGNITGDNLVGGLFGVRAGTTVVDYSFSYGSIIGATTGIGQLQGGTASANITNSYYSSTATCTNCDQAHGTGIDTSVSPIYFFDNANMPLNVWDYNSIWQGNGTSFPTHNF